MSKKRNAHVVTGITNKGKTDGVAKSSTYEHIIADLFGQACLKLLKLNEKHHDDDGYGIYSLSVSDACISVYKYRMGDEGATYLFSVYASEIESIGLDTALCSLNEVLDGEAGA